MSNTFQSERDSKKETKREILCLREGQREIEDEYVCERKREREENV